MCKQRQTCDVMGKQYSLIEKERVQLINRRSSLSEDVPRIQFGSGTQQAMRDALFRGRLA